MAHAQTFPYTTHRNTTVLPPVHSQRPAPICFVSVVAFDVFGTPLQMCPSFPQWATFTLDRPFLERLICLQTRVLNHNLRYAETWDEPKWQKNCMPASPAILRVTKYGFSWNAKVNRVCTLLTRPITFEQLNELMASTVDCTSTCLRIDDAKCDSEWSNTRDEFLSAV